MQINRTRRNAGPRGRCRPSLFGTGLSLSLFLLLVSMFDEDTLDHNLDSRAMAMVEAAGSLEGGASSSSNSIQQRMPPDNQAQAAAAWQGRKLVSNDNEYESEEEQRGRSLRFPSIDDRVRILMGSWYTPPCDESDKVPFRYETGVINGTVDKYLVYQELPIPATPARTFVAPRSFESARFLFLDRETLPKCNANDGYCDDVNEFLIPALDRVNAMAPKSDQNMPTILLFGDSNENHGYTSTALTETQKYPRVPNIQKFRAAFPGGMEDVRALTGGDAKTTTCQRTADRPRPLINDIVWRLTSHRHFGKLKAVTAKDIPWEAKQNAAIFRGKLTGAKRDGFHEGLRISDKEKCLMMHRCRLVYNSANSTIVDAGLTKKVRFISDTIEGVALKGTWLTVREQMKYKAIIMLEGNDVSSGFKWAMYSNSVVMTQKPTKSSWMMEDILEPWVHYIPLKDDLSDVEEKTQWMIDHDEEAKQIAKRGQLWVKDLLYHPDSEKDELAIYDEIIRRYRAHFREVNDLSLEAPKASA